MAALYNVQFVNTHGENLTTSVTYHNYRKAFPVEDKSYPLKVVEFRDVEGVVWRVNLADITYAGATPVDGAEAEDDI